MSQQGISWAPFIFGGLLLSVWLYGILFSFPGWRDFSLGMWLLWGVIGLVIAGGIYGGLVAKEWARVVVVTVVGIALGLLILAAILEEEAHIIASFATAAGGGLVIAGLPREIVARKRWEEVEPPADVSHQPAKRSPRKRT